MTTDEASAYLMNEHGIRRLPGTLRNLRTVGGGPSFRKAGKQVIYEAADLDAWAARITSGPLASTSEVR
jgi:hypothetical protein